MSIALALMVWRVYAFITIILILNSVSRLLFKFTMKRLGETLKSLFFIAIWPLAVFSSEGRKGILNKAKTM